MKTIRINTSYDEYDCELCGSDYAEGGEVYVDGSKVAEVEPVAHCYNRVKASEYDLLVLALASAGVDVIVDGERVFISNYKVEEQRDKLLADANRVSNHE